MSLANTVIDAIEATLYYRKERFCSIGVHVTIDVFTSTMIHGRVSASEL